MIAREESPFLSCSPDGSFEPLQCRMESGVTTCRCVQPSDGTIIPNTEVTVTDSDDIPNCNLLGKWLWKKRREGLIITIFLINTPLPYCCMFSYNILCPAVFASCVAEVGGASLGVPHGEYSVDVGTCRRCRCDNGSLIDCGPTQTCRSIQASPSSCTYRNRIIRHGENFEVSVVLDFVTLRKDDHQIIVCRWTVTDVVATMGMCDALGSHAEERPLVIAVLFVTGKRTHLSVE